MVAIIVWLVVGAVVGWVASAMMGNGGQGLVLDIVVGIVGATIGGYLMHLLGYSGRNINNALTLYSFMVSLFGAIVLLAAVNGLRRATR